MCFVRLACVKHAASVHPEPGSNSHKKFACSQTSGFLTNVPKLYCFWLRNLLVILIAVPFELNLLDLSRLFHCSIIKVRCLSETISCLRFLFLIWLARLIYHNSLFLSTCFFIFSGIFILPEPFHFQQTDLFFKLCYRRERRRRDLNPRAAINDLHPFQGCPFGQLGYFSEFFTI